jgi:hypothetical protein
MALNTQLAYATVNDQADGLSDLLDNGYLRIYDGSQPANADTAISTQVLLAELRFNATAAPAASNGVLTFNSITAEDSALANGTAAWYRCLKSDGTTVVMDGTVGTSGANLNLSSVAITIGSSVAVTSFTHTVPRA